MAGGKGRECAESCIDYLIIELVHHYRTQLQGPSLQVPVASSTGVRDVTKQPIGPLRSAP